MVPPTNVVPATSGTVVRMGIFGWIILGLLAGAIAKAIKPGTEGGGWLATMALGIVGALLGGFLGSQLFNVNISTFWSPMTWILAILGSLLVLVIWGFLSKRRA